MEANWLIQVIGDLRERIKQLEKGQIAPPSRDANDELSRLTDQLHLLLKPRGEAALKRIEAIRDAACDRVLKDLDGDYGKRYGPVPEELSHIIREHWFEMMCGFFQSAIKKDPVISTLFESRLLAGIAVELEDGKSAQVTAAQVCEQLERLGGEICSKIDQSIEMLESQQAHLGRIEFDYLAPILAAARDGEARREIIESLISDTFSTVQEISRDVKAIRDSLSDEKIGRKRTRVVNAPNLRVVIYDREKECAALLDALREEKGSSVIVMVAPGGFGKTGLLTKAIQSVREEEGDSGPAIIYVECKGGGATLLRIITGAEEVIGRQGVLQQLYARNDMTRKEKVDVLLTGMSRDGSVWMLMDNFEDLLDEDYEIKDEELRIFIERCLALDHCVRVVIATRDRPKIAGRHRPVILHSIAEALKKGLPEDDAVAFLRSEGESCGLKDAPEGLLREFVRRVHGVPMALVRVVGHLSDDVYPRVTLEKLMEDESRFEDFQRSDYEKGLRRLISEQLDRQSADGMIVLKALAFLGGPVAEPALEPLLSRRELDRVLNRLTGNRLVDVAEEIRGINHYSLHPIISEVVGERTGRDGDETDRVLTEGYAAACLRKWVGAGNKGRIRLALALAECTEKIYHYLVRTKGHHDLSNDYASALNNKGVSLRNLGRLQEAIECYDQAIAIHKRLVEEDQREELANNLATALMNKALLLEKTESWDESLALYEEAITLRRKCVREAGMVHLLPTLLETIRYRLMTLAGPARWKEAAGDVSLFLDCYDSFHKDAPRDATQNEFGQFTSVLKSLNRRDRKKLLAALDRDADRLRVEELIRE